MNKVETLRTSQRLHVMRALMMTSSIRKVKTMRREDSLTKKQMIDDIDSVVSRWYGRDTQLAKRIQRLPKKYVSKIHEVARLNEDAGDSLHEQVSLIEAHASELDARYYFELEDRRERRHARMMGWYR